MSGAGGALAAAMEILVIGAGVAGCAAAVAAAEAGARVVIAEAGHHLGGAAVGGEHRTLCGLAPIDADEAELLEPELVAAWLPAVATGAAFRQGRVWLWPTDAATLQRGLRARLAAAQVALHLGTRISRIATAAHAQDGLRIAAVMADDGERSWRPAAVIDASGAGVAAQLLGLGMAPARQWPAHRSVLRLPGLARTRSARVAALGIAEQALGGAPAPALALTPLAAQGDEWQLSLDVAPGSGVAAAAASAAAVAAALGGELLACARGIAHRDQGRPLARLGLEELFAQRERGLCWAAWPREEHLASGIAWTWPPHARHGVPEAATRPLGAPVDLWCIGKGMPVSGEAAAALRVTGTCLALGAAVGRAAALWAEAHPG